MRISEEISATLRGHLSRLKQSKIWREIVEPRDDVFKRFQPVFSPDHLPKLTVEEFKPFLYFEENHHWTNLYRKGLSACEDMPKLRRALAMLLDEKKSPEERFDLAFAGRPKGLGKAILTAILHVAYPDRFGVWNSTSEDGLIAMGLYPSFGRGESNGKKYTRINEMLLETASSVGTDLWTLDALWWGLAEAGTMDAPEEALPTPHVSIPNLLSNSMPLFGLERHLHDFLLDNWNDLELGKDWAIFATEEDEKAGYEFACPVGRIDILAKHRTQKQWLVVELKRDHTSDSVVGQALRYMGWVRKEFADAGDEVHGLIIAHAGDDALRYAVSLVPNLEFRVYEVEFRLKALPMD